MVGTSNQSALEMAIEIMENNGKPGINMGKLDISMAIYHFSLVFTVVLPLVGDTQELAGGDLGITATWLANSSGLVGVIGIIVNQTLGADWNMITCFWLVVTGT